MSQKPKSQKRGKSMDVDPRFKRLYTDPRFGPIDGRAQVSARFREMMKNEDFPLDENVDAGGNVVKKKHLDRVLDDVYDLRANKKNIYDDEEEGQTAQLSSSDDEIDIRDLKIEKKTKSDEGETISYEQFLENLRNRPGFESDDDADSDADKQKSDSDEEGWEPEDIDPEVEAELNRESVWEKFAEETTATEIDEGEETRRLAIINCDWTLINSTDLFVALKSMCPSMGNIESVTIYLSDFGAQAIEAERTQGPSNIWRTEEELEKDRMEHKAFKEWKEEKKENRMIRRNAANRKRKQRRQELEDDEDDEDDDSNSDSENESDNQSQRNNRRRGKMIIESEEGDLSIALNPDRVREYELSKLKYYFAIVVCDSVETANTLYELCDGMEFETTAVVLDLRFVPDDVSFEGRQVKDQCTEMPADYKPRHNAYSRPLTLSNVELSWDKNDDVERDKLLKRRDANVVINPIDFDKYIAPASSASESESDSELESESEPEAEAEVEAEVESEDDSTATQTATKEKKSAKKSRKQNNKSSEEVDEEMEETTEAVVEKKKKEKKKDKKEKKEKKKKKDKKKKKSSVSKYRDLVKLAQEEDDNRRVFGKSGDGDDDEDLQQNFEITFNPSADEKAREIAEKQKESAESESAPKSTETVWEAYMRKRKEKSRERKRQLKELKKQARAAATGEDIEEAATEQAMIEAHAGDDPFFKQHLQSNASNVEDIKRKKQEREEAEQKRRDALELLMMPDGEKKVRGFKVKKDKDREKTRRGKETKSLREQAANAAADAESAALNKDKISEMRERFPGLFDDPALTIDPTDPKYIKTDLTNTIVHERIKRSQQREEQSVKAALAKQKQQQQQQPSSSGSSTADISKLVDSIKRKSKQVTTTAAKQPPAKKQKTKQ